MRYAGALVDAHAGRIDAARAAAREALESSERTGMRPVRVLTIQALGFIELSLDDPAAAHAWLGPLADTYRGPHDPSLLRFLPDEIEALIALGRLDEAGAFLESFEHRVRAVRRRWALATGSRCRGLLETAHGDLAAARQALERALREHQRLPYPFELGRTLLVKGRIHRRSKQKRLARECLAAAHQIFARLGAPLWANKTRTELPYLPSTLDVAPTPAGALLRPNWERAADGGVRPPVVAEAGVAARDAERVARRAVHEQRRRRAAGGGVDRIEVEAGMT